MSREPNPRHVGLRAPCSSPGIQIQPLERRTLLSGGNALQILSRRLGIYPTVAHRALADPQTTVGVFGRLMEPIGGWDLPLCDALAAHRGASSLICRQLLFGR